MGSANTKTNPPAASAAIRTANTNLYPQSAALETTNTNPPASAAIRTNLYPALETTNTNPPASAAIQTNLYLQSAALETTNNPPAIQTANTSPYPQSDAMGTAHSQTYPESAAIESMTADLSEGIHGPQQFGNKLQKHGFVTQETLSSIMSITGHDDTTKITKMLNVVSIYVKQNQRQSTNRFNTFVYVIMVEMALEDLGQQLITKCSEHNPNYVYVPPGSARPVAGPPPQAQYIPQGAASSLCKVLAIKDLGVLQAKLCNTAHAWNNIGVQLGFDPGFLAGIKAKSFGDPLAALAELLTQWLQRVNPPPTLGTLCAIIGGPVIRNEALVLQLKREYKDFPSLQD